MQLVHSPIISAQPTNITVTELQAASFIVGVSDIVPPIFQWQRATNDIAGANSPILSLSNVALTDSNAAFRCIISNALGLVSSDYATLTVVPDTTPPSLIAANNVGVTNVTITFSERVEPASATSADNYALSGGVTTIAAILSDPQTVLLTTSPFALGSNYTLIVNQALDLASHPTTIASNSQLSFTATYFTSFNISGAVPPGALTTRTNGHGVPVGGPDLCAHAITMLVG